MEYASIGILSFLVQLIIGHNVFTKSQDTALIPAYTQYRRFFLSLMVYYVTDASWGLIYATRNVTATKIVTTLYFASVALSVLLWTRYVIAYLNQEKGFKTILLLAGQLFFVFETLLLIVNWFYPLVFTFAEDRTYTPLSMRYVSLIAQIILFLIASLHTFYIASRTEGKERSRYYTISQSGIALAVLIAFQTMYPLLPLYSIGCLLCACLLHTFVTEDIKADYRRELEELLEIEKRQMIELGSVKNMAYTDPLTGVKSKYSYLEEEERINSLIDSGKLNEFGLVIFDLNGLKIVNDTMGHDKGDRFIKKACSMICRQFSHSPVFRIGGDEFIVLLEGDDYSNRLSLINSFDLQMDENKEHGDIVVASGMDIYHPGQDTEIKSIFERADKKMYDRKNKLKGSSPSHI